MIIPNKEKQLKEKIIITGKKLYQARLVAATSGNLSAQLDKDNILITATGTSLGDLRPEDIIKVNLTKTGIEDKRLTTEFPLHRLIYEKLKAKVVIHCHPPLANGYFSVTSSLKNLTFESEIYLGDVPVIKQETPSITKPELVVEALGINNLVVIKNHGVVCVGEDFRHSFNLIETLEEAVKVTSIARLLDKGILDDLDKVLKEDLTRKNQAYTMFSKEHIQAIVDLVNQDDFIAAKGRELDLTVELAIKLDEDQRAYKFIFQKGKIIKLEDNDKAAYVISAPADIWELVFLGKLNSFVAVTQGKMKLKGQLGQLSKWFVPFNRLFELFKQVKIK
ncbi:MAG: class II aldolase/adducin family protein [Candidatus Omnitrophota bacterium]